MSDEIKTTTPEQAAPAPIPTPAPTQEAPFVLPPEALVNYHTISGGPETVHDVFKTNPPKAPVYPVTPSASGYSLPRKDVASMPPVQSGTSIFVYIFLLLLAIAGGAAWYLYKYMPELFNEIVTASTIVINTLISQVLANFQ